MLASPSAYRPCILCSFRAFIPRHLKSRIYSYGPQRDYNTASPARGRKSNAPTRTQRPVTFKAKPAPSSLSPGQLVGRVLNTALPKLKTQLMTRKASADSDVTHLSALDPRGRGWDTFEERVSKILQAPEDVISSKDSQLLSRMGRAARSGGWSDDLVYVLHHALIDHVLEYGYDKADADTGKRVATDLRYPTEWYAGARQIQREVHLHVGPTNSGKTYNALKRLEEKGNGFYAGPLRLLAHEVYSRFRAKGVPCDLVTGDDVRYDENEDVAISASTVEMVDTSRTVDVAVIDEIQMIESEDRGWAWTRAFLGSNAAEVHLCGEPRVIPLIRELTASIGDTLHVHEYKRLNGLKVMSRSLRGDFKSLKKGDCVVAFSIVTIHALKKQIEVDTGRRCAIVYGGLPPETRAQQAALFNDPDNDYDYLVASDAIGMGLNLYVRNLPLDAVPC